MRSAMIVIASVVLLSASADAQDERGLFANLVPIPAPAQPDAISLYGRLTQTQAPGGAQTARPENWQTQNGELWVRNVTVPTLTPVLPAPGTGNGAAIVVAPGGAFRALAIGNEGFSVARWLADRGIAAFVLKYRLLETPADTEEFTARIDALIAMGIAGRGCPDFCV